MSCDLIAEAGINHNGSLDRCLQMAREAAAAGCRGFKVQCYTASEFVGPAETFTYLEKDGKGAYRRVTENQRAMFDRCALSREAVASVHAECQRLKLTFVATATDASWISFLKTLSPKPVLKIGSDDLVHVPLLRAAAESGLSVILSTGMASHEEVVAAVEIVRPIVLLHCVSLYPTPIQKANLSRMDRLGALGFPVGFSDHTEGALAPMLAAAMGAVMVERHFTLDRNLPGPDHWFSSDPPEMKTIAGAIRTAAEARGTGQSRASELEGEMRLVARRSVVAAEAIPAGTALRQSMVAYRRPGVGVQPGGESRWIGRVTSRRVEEGEALSDSAFMPGGEIPN